MNADYTCACGETFGTPEELDDHFHEVFTPPDDTAPDDTAPDGKLHAEL